MNNNLILFCLKAYVVQMAIVVVVVVVERCIGRTQFQVKEQTVNEWF